MDRRVKGAISPVRVSSFQLGGGEFVVASFAIAPPGSVAKLSEGEREVARLIAEGLSNKAIASRRGTALRTVANQAASIFKKLGVGSRVGLAAALGSTTSADEGE